MGETGAKERAIWQISSSTFAWLRAASFGRALLRRRNWRRKDKHKHGQLAANCGHGAGKMGGKWVEKRRKRGGNSERKREKKKKKEKKIGVEWRNCTKSTVCQWRRMSAVESR